MGIETAYRHIGVMGGKTALQMEMLVVGCQEQAIRN
jgi:hypothetical protein